MQCEVKSKYRGLWEQGMLSLDPQSVAFHLARGESSKLLKFVNILACSIKNIQEEELLVIQLQKRVYQIRGDLSKIKNVVEAYKLWNFFKNYKDFQEGELQKPKAINYQQKITELNRKKQLLLQSKQSPSLRVQVQKQIQKEVVEYQQYYKKEVWRRDIEEGGLLNICQKIQDLQPKMIKFVISKFLSTGSFMGISFPVFAMKSESNLQSYCRCFSLAPRLLSGIKNPIERMKAFNALILTFSIRYTDLEKSFNPTIGQTFQGELQGFSVTAEQVSHHPPITAFLFNCDDFRLYGSIEVCASIGINSAKGRFFGEVVAEYKDGGKIIGMIPSGILSGFIFGRNVFNPTGPCYAYDPANQLITCYQTMRDDVIEGYLGKLNYHKWMEFCQMMNSNPTDPREKKYDSFEFIPETECEKVYTRLKSIWTKGITYDDVTFLDYEEEKIKPPKLSSKIPKNLLESDCRHRLDIKLRKEERMDESQEEKERMEQEQRRLRKLREAHHQP